MSENLKCPCCGVIVMVLVKGTMECFKCPFVCARKDFPRIAAAMELAKAKQKRETIGRNIFGDWDEYDENLWQAERRVLEVFQMSVKTCIAPTPEEETIGRQGMRIAQLENQHAALLARHAALVEAVKWMLYIDTPENFEGGKHIAARAEVDKLLKEEL